MGTVLTDFAFTLNGRPVRVRDTAASVTLLDFVRSQGLTGAKEGCAEGECGACAVLLISDAGANRRSVYRAVNGCLVPLPAVAGREVFTVEGIAENGRLSEVQRAMAEGGGSQCGYCTAGFVVSMFAEQHRCPPDQRDLHSLGGNLCRCTGYRPIQDAFLSLGPAPESSLRERLGRPVTPLPALDYGSRAGRFSRPLLLAEALRLAAEDEAATFVAGNTDLGVVSNLRDIRFAHLISLEGVEELRRFKDGPDAVEIGSGLTLTEIDELWTDAPSVIGQWLRLFASVLIRNRATLGGSLATASPIGDSAPLLMALGAEVRIASLAGERTIPVDQFFLGYRRTVLQPGEMITSVCIPRPFPEKAQFYKVAKRSLDDISTVAACIATWGDVRKVRIAFGGVAALPWRAREAELVLENSGNLQEAQQTLRDALQPMTDHRGSAAYRLAMAQSLLEKFLQ